MLNKFKTLLISGSVILLIVSVIASFIYVHNAAIKSTELKYAQIMIEKQWQYEESMRKLQTELYDIENSWLEDERKTVIEYRDKVKVITKTVKEYIEVNNLENCKVGSDIMKDINSAIMRKND